MVSKHAATALPGGSAKPRVSKTSAQRSSGRALLAKSGGVAASSAKSAANRPSAQGVADRPASLLVSAFHSALVSEPQLSHAEALGAAMREVRAADGGRWTHPAYWAGFALTGVARGC